MIDSINFLNKYGFPEIAEICEKIGLENPYPYNTLEHRLWNDFTHKNVPFLIVLCNTIYYYYNYNKIKTILFTTRDCVFLKSLFNCIYPNIETDTFYSSRALYLFPPQEYIPYCTHKLRQDALVIDLQGTGQSFKNLTDKLNLSPWYLLVHWNSTDKATYFKSSLAEYSKKIIVREFTFYNDAIEKLNIDLVGTYFHYIDNKPISYEYEYDPSVVKTLHESFECFLNVLKNIDLDKLKNYRWDTNFRFWMDQYYNIFNTQTINWIHTHFKYDQKFIDQIRENYVTKNC